MILNYTRQCFNFFLILLTTHLHTTYIQKIKSEIHFKYRGNLESDNEEDENDVDMNEITNEHCEEMSDPLLTVLKGDSGIGIF